jgi:phosphate:Na+ symporter
MIGFIEILGGLALFLFGMRLLSAGMEKLAGDKIQVWLDRMTSGRLRSAAFGAVATALIQSSGLLMATMIGLINANLMTVEQAVSVMLGQEIGTTLTAQIVAFDIGNIRLLFIIIGLVFLEFFPHRDWRKYGEISMGLGVIFLGMTLMAGALDPLREIPWVAQGLEAMGAYPLVGVLIGLVFTSLVQSSGAVTAMTVAMGIKQAITLNAAVGVILGANIGSCITGFMAAIRLSRSARQASIAQIFINVLGVLLFLPFITPYANLVSLTSSDLPRQIANAHTIFNVAVSALFFPFVRQISRLVKWLIPERPATSKPRLTAYIDEMQYSVPAVALSEAARELVRIGEVTAQMLDSSRRALLEQDTTLAQQVLAQEEDLVDPVCKEIGFFVNGLMQQDLSVAQQRRCFQIKNLLIDIERVGDMAEDLAQVAIERVQDQVEFSEQATQELDRLWQHAHHTYTLALESLQSGNRDLAQQVCRLEGDFDLLYWQTRQGHIDRLENGLCQPEADVIFTETLRNLERVSDHADNLGVSVIRA